MALLVIGMCCSFHMPSFLKLLEVNYSKARFTRGIEDAVITLNNIFSKNEECYSNISCKIVKLK